MIKFKNIFIRTRPSIDDNVKAQEITNKIINTIKGHFDILEDPTNITKDTLVVSVGGDGTFLGAAKTAYHFNSTVTGFNLGRKGFLVDNNPDEVLLFFKSLTLNNEDYNIRKRSVIKFNNIHAINEFYITPTSPGYSLVTSVYVDGSKALEAIGSGVLIATPTGSTAFSLSAGGPVISPDSRTFVITPVMPHTLSSRPLIVNDTSTIEVEWTRGSGSVYADGRWVDDYDGWKEPQRIILKRPQRQLQILQKKSWNFYDTLREKISWNK